MTVLALTELTDSTTTGSGVFDSLMRSMKAHLEGEFKANRIKGPEYATVYLGSLTPILNASMQFLMAREKLGLENALLVKQATLIEKQIALAAAQALNLAAELAIATANLQKVPAEIAQLTAQTAMVTQQTANAVLTAANIPKEGLVLTAQKNKVDADTLQVTAQTAMTNQQKSNLLLQADNIPKEGLVLNGQKCKLDAEFDILGLQKLNTATENALLTQKIATEKAQTTALGVDADSVVGRQKSLYQAQTAGFARDAEQKAAKLLVDTWNVRRTTDDATIAGQARDANGNPLGVDNRLGDVDVARMVAKLMAGVGA